MSSRSLRSMLDTVAQSIENERVKVGALFQALNRRGFGSLLLVPALFVISPVGALPGACAIFGGLIFLTSIQMVFGRHDLWLPKWLKKKSFRGKKLQLAIEKAKPYAGIVDRYLESRLSLLAENEIVIRVTAFISAVLAVGIMSLSLVPFAPAALALPVLFFALGLSVRDGIMIAAGYLMLFVLGSWAMTALI